MLQIQWAFLGSGGGGTKAALSLQKMTGGRTKAALFFFLTFLPKKPSQAKRWFFLMESEAT